MVWSLLSCPPCVFPGEVSAKVCGSFFKWLFFFLLSCEGSLYMWDASPFPDVSCADIFSQFVVCLILLDLVFARQKVLN